MTEIELVALAICKSRTCEGSACCQWPANGGRLRCPVKAGGYEDAAREAIQALDNFRYAEKRRTCKHHSKMGTGCIGSDGIGWSTWFCQECGASYDSRTLAITQAQNSSPIETPHRGSSDVFQKPSG